jgi:hypothetical protein
LSTVLGDWMADTTGLGRADKFSKGVLREAIDGGGWAGLPLGLLATRQLKGGFSPI